jgi:hypothetical protein
MRLRMLLVCGLLACDSQPSQLEQLTDAYCRDLEARLDAAVDVAATSMAADPPLYELGLNTFGLARDVVFCFGVHAGPEVADREVHRVHAAYTPFFQQIGRERTGRRALPAAQRVAFYKVLRALVAELNARPLVRSLW